MANHILIVEDEQAMVELLRIMLKSFGYPVEGASNGKEALTLAHIDPPMLVLLDLMLPDMRGFEVCQALKSSPATANVPVVMLTARHDSQARDEALAAGADFFLAKPVTRAQLKDCLQAVLEKTDNSLYGV